MDPKRKPRNRLALLKSQLTSTSKLSKSRRKVTENLNNKKTLKEQEKRASVESKQKTRKQMTGKLKKQSEEMIDGRGEENTDSEEQVIFDKIATHNRVWFTKKLNPETSSDERDSGFRIEVTQKYKEEKSEMSSDMQKKSSEEHEMGSNEQDRTVELNYADEYNEKIAEEHRKGNVHVRNGKKVNPLVMCPVCGQFITRKNIARHKKSHMNFVYRCTYCFLYFDNKEKLKAHNLLRHREVVICEYCAKAFARKSSLTNHIQRIHQVVSVPYPCSQCDKGFSSIKLLQDHMNVHRNIKPYSCPLCCQGFAYMSSQRKHVRLQVCRGGTCTSKQRIRKMSCRICQEDFYSLTTFKDHIQQHAFNDVQEPVDKASDSDNHSTYCEDPASYHEDIALNSEDNASEHADEESDGENLTSDHEDKESDCENLTSDHDDKLPDGENLTSDYEEK